MTEVGVWAVSWKSDPTLENFDSEPFSPAVSRQEWLFSNHIGPEGFFLSQQKKQ